MIEIYVVNVGGILGRPLSPSLVKIVDAEKQSRIMNFRRREDANRTLYSDLLARAVLAHRTGRSPVEFRFLTSGNGKPRLAGEADPFFSLSHSGNWIVCAAGEFVIGVDVEEIRAFDPATAEEFLSDGEQDEFARLAGDSRRNYYFKIWTLKESFAKAVGFGLGLPFRDLSVRFGPSGGIFLQRKGKPLQDVFFQSGELDDHHWMSACSLGERLPGNVIHWDFSRLLRLDPLESAYE